VPAEPARHGLSYQIAQVIESRSLTAYAVARLAGLDPGVVARWRDGRRGLTLASAERIAAALGLRLVEVAAPGRRKSR
jgi:transcriptional regulator with XRE-family HTH domain